jgi:hypothetical protein
VPETCHATTLDLKAKDQYTWHLDAFAAVPGIDYVSSFKVQLFALRDGEQLPDIADPAEAYRDHGDPPLPRGVEFSVPAPGVKRFTFRRAHAAATAINVGMITLLFIVGTAALPDEFRGRCSGWHTSSISACSGRALACGFERRPSMCGATQSKSADRGSASDDRLSSRAKPSSTSGLQQHDRGNNSYYRIELQLSHKRKINAGGMIRGIRDAQWIADEMQKRLVCLDMRLKRERRATRSVAAIGFQLFRLA